MSQNLVIVESPAKAKTIEKYLGSAFTVRSSFGHIRDLPERGIGIDVAKNFAPEYVVSDDKKDVVAQLRKLAKTAETVWLASDEDREGEAISWHLADSDSQFVRSRSALCDHCVALHSSHARKWVGGP